MAQTYPLDLVIRKVPPGVATADAQRVVMVDVETGKSLQHRRFWDDVQHFLVSNRNDPAHESLLEVPSVVLADIDERLEVSVDLRVSCPPGHESRVAEALFDPADAPHVVLERHVVRSLREMGREDVRAFARRLVADPAAVQRELAEAVARGTGLRVHVRVALDVPDQEAVRVEVDHLPVVVAGWDEELDLGIRADLEVDDAGRAEAVLNRARVPELHTLVPREIRAFVRRRVSLAEFPALAAGPPKQALVAHLDDVLRPFGRRVAALVLRPAAASSVPAELSVLEQVEVPCTVREYPSPVMIGNRVLVRVDDLVRYRAQGSPELRAWLRETLTRLIPEALFAARYTDLLLDFAPWEERIKELTRAAAAEIGCEIRQFITDPDLPERVLTESFDIRTEQSFATRLHGVEATLEVVVTARIPHLEKIAPLLRRGLDVPSAMEKAVRTVVGTRMNTIHPERVFMRFGFTDPRRDGEEAQSVEAELTEVVERRLTGDEFHAKVVGVVIKVAETELARRFRELLEATPDFSVRVGSLEAEEVTFVGALRVVDVHPDGWKRFYALTGGIRQVTDKVRDHVDTILHTLPPEVLLYQTEAERTMLEIRVSRSVAGYVAEQFGLLVRISNFRRTRTEIEAAYHERLLDAWKQEAEADGKLQLADADTRLREYAGLAEARGRLTNHLTTLIGVEDEEEEVARMEREIEAITTRMEAALSHSSAQLRRRVRGPTAADRHLPAGDPEAEAALAVGADALADALPDEAEEEP